jgi:WD40 repeat protein
VNETLRPIRVFISSPGDLFPERRIIEEVLLELNNSSEYQGHYEFVPYAYENIVPARAAMSTQHVIDSYMLRPEDADIFICIFWMRMGTPPKDLIDPATGKPYQSGTEYEFLTAYRASEQNQRPIVLLYRCNRLPEEEAEQEQLDQVEAFFARFGPQGDLRGMYNTFGDEISLRTIIKRDVATILQQDISKLFERSAGNREGPVYFLPRNLPASYVERPESLASMRKALLGSRKTVGVIATTALHGQGGLGKTVLARAICNDPSVRAAFSDGILWATLGQGISEGGIVAIQRDWIRVLGGDIPAATNAASGKVELERLAIDKALLFILDDVWHAENASPLLINGEQCRTLITTRDITQVEGASLITLEVMQPQESRALLLRASNNVINDPNLLNTIAARVGYLPLALHLIGTLLGDGISWDAIQSRLDTGKTGMLDRVTAAMDASIAVLSDDQQERYRELVIFPEDNSLVVASVMRLWKHTSNYDDFDTQRLLALFRKRSLLQADNTLHDLQYDYLRAHTTDNEREQWHKSLLASYGGPSAWSNLPDDDEDYGWRYLAWHLVQSKNQDELRTLLTDVGYIQSKMTHLGVAALLADLQLEKNNASVNTLTQIIRAASPILQRDSTELENQIIGRVGRIPNLHNIPNHTLPAFVLRSRSLLPPDPALVRIYSGHQGGINSCVFNGDGTQILSAGDDRTLRLWDTENGETIRAFTGHSNVVMEGVFSPDGHSILSAGEDQTLRLWDIETGAQIRTFTVHAGLVTGCAISPDGTLALGSADNRTLILWDIETGALLRTFTGSKRAIFGCRFSPDSRYVLGASSNHSIWLWDISTGDLIREFTGHSRTVYTAEFSSDGKLIVSAAQDSTVRIWNTATGECLHVCEGHQGGVIRAIFSPDDRMILSASADRTLRLWDVATGATIRIFTGHTASVNGCAFSPDGKHILSASNDYTLRLWNLTSAESNSTTSSHSRAIRACTIVSDGKLAVTASADQTLRIWNISKMESQQALEGHSQDLYTCAVTPNGHILYSGGNDKVIHIWDLGTGTLKDTLEPHGGMIRCCDVSPNGQQILVACGHYRLLLLDGNSGKLLRDFSGHTAMLNHCTFSPDGKLAASGADDRIVKLWNVDQGKAICSLRGHDAGVSYCAFSP